MQTDSQWVANIDTLLAAEYDKARDYAYEVPTQCLLHIRAFTHRLCQLLAGGEGFDSVNLFDNIEQLNRQRRINVRLARALHKLRGHGNRGAHPEKYHLTPDALLALAEKALSDARVVLALACEQLSPQSTHDYQIQPLGQDAGRELCYRAVMEDDCRSQYLLGMSFKAKALLLQEQEQALNDEAHGDDNPGHASQALLAKAMYWFGLAHRCDMDARFEYGVALLHGYQGEPDRCAGERLIAEAAAAGIVNAAALQGYFYLTGTECIAANLDQAQRYLETAAEQDNAEAMCNLGVLYYQQGQLTQAFDYSVKAADAGFAQAQYHLALMLAKGEGCQADAALSAHWLAEAAEQGQLDAMLLRAQQLLNDESLAPKDLTLAESYLRQVIRYGHSVPAMIELSVALTDGMLGRIDVVGAAALLSSAHRHADAHHGDIILALQQSLQLQLAQVIPLTQDCEELKALQRAEQLLAGLSSPPS
ncbi:DUF4145 domain-containing protein [Shewanella sp. NIFS-20-20]|uniref:DUF4145 domain-containing protein n=1 Tax=Shewanella sp. NIFS-20-20 TaxID=2853806 RepID=UPI001C448656|nr:DUF4145 domain-containing protein [Shewanella sp. NIFS-20-20]